MEGTDEIVKPPGQDHLIFDWQSASHVLPKVAPRRVSLKHAGQGNFTKKVKGTTDPGYRVYNLNYFLN